MNKEKLVKLKRYLDHLTNMNLAAIPEKHKDHPETYKLFLSREMATVKKQIDTAVLEGAGK